MLLLPPALLQAPQQPSLQEVVEHFDAAQAQAQTVEAPFTLTTRRALLKTPTTTHGMLYLQGSDFAHFIFASPEDLILHLTPQELLSYSPSAKQGERLKVGHIIHANRRFLGLGQKLSFLSQYFDIGLGTSSDVPGTWFLTLTPKTLSMKRRMQALDLWVDQKTWLPRRVLWVERGGDTWQLDLGTLKINQPLPVSVTGFQVPPGTPLTKSFSFFATPHK